MYPPLKPVPPAIHSPPSVRSPYNGALISSFPKGVLCYKPNLLQSETPWRHWVELTIRIAGLPFSFGGSGVSTLDIYKAFQEWGEIVKIAIDEDDYGRQSGTANITFMPPPKHPFWQQEMLDCKLTNGKNVRLSMNCLNQKRTFLHPSPVNPDRKYRERLFIHAKSIDFCVLVEEAKLMVMHKVTATLGASVTFLVNLLRREIVISFDLNPAKKGQRYKFSIRLRQIDKFWRRTLNGKELELILPLKVPPRFYRRHETIDATHEDGSRFWTEEGSWFRQTDISNTAARTKAPFALRKQDALVDIGRWTTYRLIFDEQAFDANDGMAIIEALNDYNIRFHDPGPLQKLEYGNVSGWESIDISTDPRLDLQLQGAVYLSFAVRYQLEVCLSQGCLSEYNITHDWVLRLSKLKEREAIRRLETVADLGHRIFDPMTIFDIYPRPSPWSKLPKHLVLVRTATVTPSTIRYSSPTVETSNRVVRHFLSYADRFLRVRFAEEQFGGKIYSVGDNSQDALYTRVKRCLTNGIRIGDRTYKYLAAGNSQFREHGAFFFANSADLKIEDIRAWMGDFSHIKSVAKYASRIGQCFSTTRAISTCSVNVKKLDDIERNGCNFTDGVGKISKFLAQAIANDLGISKEDPPSVFQFRLGGSKGVFAVSPSAGYRDVYVRPSQEKFVANHQGLEIIRCASHSHAQLNRQLIMILSNLGVQQSVFLNMLRLQLLDLERAMHDADHAVAMLQKKVDPNQATLNIASLVLNGFMQQNDPFTMSVLRLWRAWSMKNLKEKASLDVDKGTFVLGCIDETATLKGHVEANTVNVSRQKARKRLPEIFLQIKRSNTDGTREIITGTCVLARNPSLHPGDIRIVQAVDVPALHHIYDAVVFPQTGDRDIPGMCSGGDLDGDDFFISWDPLLIPPSCEWNHPAMDFTGLKPDVVRNVTEDNITTFFVNYMKNDCLGIIAHAHLANADRLEQGVKDPRCIRLAEQHSIAVDYNKSGKPAFMPADLRARQKPHYMMKKDSAQERFYHSKKILGQLYDAVSCTDFEPTYSLNFDARILESAIQPSLEILGKMGQLKIQYDSAICRIMAQHEIATEFEVWSTFCMQHSRLSNDYKFHEELGRLAESLRSSFRLAVEEEAGGKDFEKLAPYVVAMYKVTAQDATAFIEDNRGLQLKGQKRPLISFPWVFFEKLGQIARAQNTRGGQQQSSDQFADMTLLDSQPAASVALNCEGSDKTVDISPLQMTSESLLDKDLPPLCARSDGACYDANKQSTQSSSIESALISLENSIALSLADNAGSKPAGLPPDGRSHSSSKHSPKTTQNSVDLADLDFDNRTTQTILDALAHSQQTQQTMTVNKATQFTDQRPLDCPKLGTRYPDGGDENDSDAANGSDHESEIVVDDDSDNEPSALEKLGASLGHMTTNQPYFLGDGDGLEE